MSLNVHEEMDQGEDCQHVLRAYFEEFVQPLAAEVPLPEALERARRLSGTGPAGAGAGVGGSPVSEPAPVTRQRS